MFNLGFTASSSVAPSQDQPPCPRTRTRGKRTRRRRRNRRNMIRVELAKRHDAPMTKSDLYFALDCEMVGIGPEGFDSGLARVTVVNWDCEIVLDTFVQVPVPVTDYRTEISGIKPSDLEAGVPFEEARRAVERILRGKILIGHGLENDLCALGLTHPWCDVRDTACYKPFMRQSVDLHTGGVVWQPRKLRDLSWEFLGRQIQDHTHCPIEDATSALDLYKSVRDDWERELMEFQRERNRQEEEQRLKSFGYWTRAMESMPPPQTANVDPSVDPCSALSIPIQEIPPVPGYTPITPPLSPMSWFRFSSSTTKSSFSLWSSKSSPPSMSVALAEREQFTYQLGEEISMAAADENISQGMPAEDGDPKLFTTPNKQSSTEPLHQVEDFCVPIIASDHEKQSGAKRNFSSSSFSLPRLSRTSTKITPIESPQGKAKAHDTECYDEEETLPWEIRRLNLNELVEI